MKSKLLDIVGQIVKSWLIGKNCQITDLSFDELTIVAAISNPNIKTSINFCHLKPASFKTSLDGWLHGKSLRFHFDLKHDNWLLSVFTSILYMIIDHYSRFDLVIRYEWVIVIWVIVVVVIIDSEIVHCFAVAQW